MDEYTQHFWMFLYVRRLQLDPLSTDAVAFCEREIARQAKGASKSPGEVYRRTAAGGVSTAMDGPRACSWSHLTLTC